MLVNNNLVSVTVVADSINKYSKRLTTLECVYPRYIHAEIMTHRVFSRSAQSSRAIPVSRLIDNVQSDTWFPIFTKNVKGMASKEYLTGRELALAKEMWLTSKTAAVHYASNMAGMDIHKQNVNRILEPYSKITVLISSTEWENFFKLRLNADTVQPEMYILAKEMLDKMNKSSPRLLENDDWHLPYVLDGEREYHSIDQLKKLSTARCARVSYLNHNGMRNPDEDYRLHDDLKRDKHLSPFEMVATVSVEEDEWANYKLYRQYRYEIETFDR